MSRLDLSVFLTSADLTRADLKAFILQTAGGSWSECYAGTVYQDGQQVDIEPIREITDWDEETTYLAFCAMYGQPPRAGVKLAYRYQDKRLAEQMQQALALFTSQMDQKTHNIQGCGMEHFLLTLRVLGLANYSLHTLLRAFGPPQSAEPEPLGDWLAVAGQRYAWLRQPKRDAIKWATEMAADLLTEIYRLGWEVQGRYSVDYPPCLKGLKDAPLLLFSQGDVTLLGQPLVGIVGSRAPSVQGEALCDWSAEQVVTAGFTLLSSLERGIDARVHSAGERLGGPTIAVLGNGLDQLYPERQRRLADAILAEDGCLISAQWPGSRLTPSRAEERHRLLSGLCQGLILIEARGSGGAETCLRYARNFRRSLAFPSFEQIGRPDQSIDFQPGLGKIQGGR